MGAGQLINRQPGKAAFFFAFYAAAIAWEMVTGNYYAGMEFTPRQRRLLRQGPVGPDHPR
ncbi:hypothetical protein GCM10029992_50250 [Glycomyces albus]